MFGDGPINGGPIGEDFALEQLLSEDRWFGIEQVEFQLTADLPDVSWERVERVGQIRAAFRIQSDHRSGKPLDEQPQQRGLAATSCTADVPMVIELDQVQSDRVERRPVADADLRSGVLDSTTGAAAGSFVGVWREPGNCLGDSARDQGVGNG